MTEWVERAKARHEALATRYERQHGAQWARYKAAMTGPIAVAKAAGDEWERLGRLADFHDGEFMRLCEEFPRGPT